MTKTLLGTTLCFEFEGHFEGQYFNPCGLEIYNGGSYVMS